MIKIHCSNSRKIRISELIQANGRVYLMFFAAIIFAVVLPSLLFAQSPVISYSSPQTYTAGHGITPLAPSVTSKPGLPNYNQPKNYGGALTVGVALDHAGNVYFTAADSNIYVISAGSTGDGVFFEKAGVANAEALARDAAGNMYVADTTVVMEIPAGGGVPFIKGHFVNAQGIASDGAGNVYVADYGGNAVYKIPAGSTSPALVTNASAPNCVALDSLGDVFIGITSNNSLIELPFTGGSVVISSSFDPVNLAVDGTGNIFFTADFDLYEQRANGGRLIRISDFNLADHSPNGVAVDSADVVYIAGSEDNSVKKFIPAGGYYISSALPQGLMFSDSTGVISGTPTIATPKKTYTITAYKGEMPGTAQVAITITGAGTPKTTLSGLTISEGTLSPSFSTDSTIYNASVSDTTESISVTPTATDTTSTIKVNGTLVKSGAAISLPLSVGTNTITVLVTATNATKESYTITVTRPKVPLTVTANNITTPQGIPLPPLSISYSGFIDGDTPSILITQPTPKTSATSTSALGAYTINVNGGASNKYSFKYVKGTLTLTAEMLSYPGPQSYPAGSAITPLVPSSSGVAPQAFAVNKITGYYFNLPAGLAVDAGGNIYIGFYSPTISKVFSTLNGYENVGSGFKYVKGLAVDSKGNVYASDQNEIKEVLAGSDSVIILGASHTFNDPRGLAVDAAGNVYAADYKNNKVIKIPVGGGTPVSIASGFNHPSGLALDASGNLYVADQGNDEVKMVPGATGTPVILTSGFEPSGVAVDAGGNVYVTDTQNGQVKMIPAGNGTPVVISSGYSNADQIAVDTKGNIYVTDIDSTLVKQIRVNGGYYAGPALPAGLSLDANTGIISGTPTVTSPPTVYTITGFNLVTSKSATVSIAVSIDDDLSSLNLSKGSLSPAFDPDSTTYTATFAGTVKTVGLVPTTDDPNATVTVNGVAVKSGKSTGPETLNTGPNTFTIVVTAVDGVSKKTYTATIYKGSAVTTLSGLSVSSGKLSPSFNKNTTGYAVSEDNSTSSVTLQPTATNAGATITVNGMPVASGSSSPSITLNVGLNTVPVTVTAQNGLGTETYTVNITRLPNVYLSSLTLSNGTLSPAFDETITNYTASVPNYIKSTGLTPTAVDPNATITMNGSAVKSGKSTGPQPLNVGPNLFTIVVTGTDGTTTETYKVTITKSAPGGDAIVSETNDDVSVSPAVSPNGDGKNDVLTIKNIEKYPVNKVMVMNSSGVKIFEMTGYDNVNKTFNGRSNITGQLQPEGTYYYELQYSDNGVLKTKTGYLVLKY